MQLYTVLIIDDSMVDIKIMKKVLETSDSGLKVIYNLNGYNYLEQILEFNVKVIILNLQINDVNGRDILFALKNGSQTTQIPIILCSSAQYENKDHEYFFLVAYDYIEKPLSDTAIHLTLLMKVKNALTYNKQLEKIYALSAYDEVSGLGTRKYFESLFVDTMKIQGSTTKKNDYSIALIDVNGLKLINDAYGPQIGDMVLGEIGKIIKEVDTLYLSAARWGSDEIILLIEGNSKSHVEEICMKIQHEINSKKQYLYDVTFGYATSNDSSNKIEDLVRMAEDNLYSNKILEVGNVRRTMIDTILKTLHEKNPREEIHSRRVSYISAKICQELLFSEHETRRVRLAALMHDIGKIAVSEEILNKPTTLNNKEWVEMRKHPENGFKILSTSLETLELANAVFSHHEHWDGNGYPKGLSGESIPLMARVISVADTFDAITNKRSYKKSIPTQDAIDEIKRCSGSQFDPKIVDAFLRYISNKKDGIDM